MPRTNNTDLRERTISILKAAGYTNREVAESMNISSSIVSKYDRRYHFNKFYKANLTSI